MNARKAADEKLRESLRECMQVKNAMIDEEIQPYEDHVFSDKFEAEIKKLLVVRNKKAERAKLFKYAVSVAAAILVVVGIVSASATSTKATLPSIDILGWFDTHFEFGKGTSTSEDNELIFDEEQIKNICEIYHGWQTYTDLEPYDKPELYHAASIDEIEAAFITFSIGTWFVSIYVFASSSIFSLINSFIPFVLLSVFK